MTIAAAANSAMNGQPARWMGTKGVFNGLRPFKVSRS
jgi:hypothetical protein